MRLIRCHIEGFGAFCKQDFIFDEKLTEFCHENGWGKTTLVDFITAMLYGLPTARDGGAFHKRQRYLPFDGGRFGGNLLLSIDGKEWRIERFFDPKSETKDTLTVYCNNSEVFMTRGEVGLRLLGVDEDTFRRLSLVGDHQIEVGDNHELGDKLQSTLDDTADPNQFKKIITALEELIKVLKPARRSATNKGKINTCKEKIKKLETELAELRTIEASLPRHYAELREIQATIASLEARIAAIQAMELQKQRWETYQNLLKSAERAREEISSLLAKYPEGFPSQEELTRLKKLEEERIGLEAQKNAPEVTDEGARLALLKKKYPKGVPTREELAVAEPLLSTYEENKNQLAAFERDSIETLDPSISALFALGVPDEAHLERMRALSGEIGELEDKIQARSMAETALVTKKKPAGLLAVLFGGGALLAVVGGILMATNTGIGIALLIGGLLALVGGAVVALGGKPALDHTTILALQGEKNEKINALRSLLIPYRLGENPLVDYSRLVSAYQTYVSYQERVGTREERRLACEREVEEARAALEAFLVRYVPLSSHLREDLEELRQDARDLESLSKGEEQRKEARESLQERLISNAREIARFLEEYKLERPESLSDCIETLQRDQNRYEELLRSCERASREAQLYYLQEGLTTAPVPTEDNEEALQAEYNAYVERKANKIGDIDSYEREIAFLVEREEELAALEEELAILEEQYTALSLTHDFLIKAEQNIIDRYVEPVRGTLSEYLDKVELVLGEGLRLDENFSLQFEAGGALRPEGHLSAGQRAICGLCFRLAMLPHLYQDATPFVLLDDPFGVVDEQYMEKLGALLKELSQEMQIVYFCCHKSRSVL